MKDSNRARVLIAEDDDALLEALCDTLELAGVSVEGVESGEGALLKLERNSFDLLVSDVNMGGIDGHELLRTVRTKHPQLPVVLITAYGSIAHSVSAMRDGAVDYLVKPFEPELLLRVVEQHACGKSARDASTPVAVDPVSIELLQIAERVAATDSTVLILGESGSGKEVLARYIHARSARSEGPFIGLNCAAIPENMLEAMLFGHEKGAFTGAHCARPGKFEQAQGGTLLLDEISEMDPILQAKLLRVLQEREVERLGGRHLIAVDVRVLATSNRDLREEVANNRFRDDLYYRLSVFPLTCQSLRDRPLDIMPLAKHLAAHHAEKMGRAPVSFDEFAHEKLRSHQWPGNVRELDNVVQRALILQPDNIISEIHLSLDPYSTGIRNIAQLAEQSTAQPDVGELNRDLKEHEFEIILGALKEEGGSKKAASERLGISPRTLRYKLARMREAGIDVDNRLAAANSVSS